MLRHAIFVATSLLLGCPSKQPEAPRTAEDAPLRIRIAQAEARRAAGIDELIELAKTGDMHARELALRGLGRIGGEKALAALEQALTAPEPRIVIAALYALGVAGSLDDLDAATQKRLGVSIIKAKGFVPDARLAALEALGRVGDAATQDQFAVEANGTNPPELIAAGAFAFARHGRRKIKFVAARPPRTLLDGLMHPDSAVRFAAAYAFQREHEPGEDVGEQRGNAAANALLAKLVVDDMPETRAVAISALAKRKAIGIARKQIEESLRDRDRRVAVEAVRALAGPNGDDAGRATVAEALRLRWAELEKGNAADAHVITEALRTLLQHPTGNQTAIATVMHIGGLAAKESPAISPLTRGWIECLGAAAAAAGLEVQSSSGGSAAAQGSKPASSGSAAAQGSKPASGGSVGAAPPTANSAGNTVGASLAIDTLATCGRGRLPDHLRLPLLVDFAKGRAATYKRAALRVLLAHEDPRVRAAGLGLLSDTWKDGDAKAQATIVGTVTSALATKNQIVAGTAVDVAGELYEAMAADHPLRATLDTAIVTRAKTETDVEVAAALYTLLGKRNVPGAADVCRAGLSGAPARAKAAAECLRTLGEATALPATTAAEPPPGDVATVIGKQLFWHLATTRGEVVIELRPDVAPWAVASIVALTRRGFYDGLEFHRVVPNFVVQGGDPTQSGWGGPGYALPAEPASSADGPGYVAGGVGMADAGRDSAGSQWFIMHSRAPHLDGRYTWFGSVVSGQKSADSLLIGDKVEKATVEQR